MLSEKVNLQTKITLVEKRNALSDPEISSKISCHLKCLEKVISDDIRIAETFRDFFVNIVPRLKISPKESFETDEGNDNEPVLITLTSLKIIPAPKLQNLEKRANFIIFLVKNFLTKLRNYKPWKPKILNKNSDVLARYFHASINFSIENSIFSSDLKVANVTPAFKKKSKTSKHNCRPIRILPNISKIYERCVYNQTQTYFDEILSKC